MLFVLAELSEDITRNAVSILVDRIGRAARLTSTHDTPEKSHPCLWTDMRTSSILYNHPSESFIAYFDEKSEQYSR